MSMPVSGTIKFSQIRNVFNSSGVGLPISIKTYYANSGTGYTTNIILIPRSNVVPIKIKYFYKLSKTSTYPIIKVNNVIVNFIASPDYTKAYYIFDNTIYANYVEYNRRMVVDYLIVGGGAGGSTANDGGGGGAGSVNYIPNITQGMNGATISGTFYIGSGGGPGANGNDTTFAGTIVNKGISSTNSSGGGPASKNISDVITTYYGSSSGTADIDVYKGRWYAGGGAGAGGNGGPAYGGSGFYVDITESGNPVEFGTGGGGALAYNNDPSAAYYGINSGADRGIYGGGGHGNVNRFGFAATAGYKGCVIIALKRQ